MTLDEFEKELERGLLRPLYLMLGPEGYFRQSAVQLLKRTALAPDVVSLNYAEFSGRTASIREILEAANTLPMMSPRRVLLLTDLQAMEESQKEALAVYSRKAITKTVLVLIAEDLDRRTTFYKLLKENVAIVEFPKLKGFALERWAEERVRSQGYWISSGSVRKIIDLVGSDLQVLASEIEKLLLYCVDGKAISDSVVDQMVRGSRQHSVFELIGALGMRNRRKALRLLGDLINAGEDPLRVVAMMARHFRQVLIVQDLLSQDRNFSEIGITAQIPHFIVDDFIRQARALDHATAEKMYLLLADADNRFKSTGVDKRMFLEKLICSL